MFEHNTREAGTETNKNYKLVIQDMISNLFTPKALQHQKICLHRGLYKPRKINICDFIFRINKIIGYLDHFPSFGENQGLPEY